MPAYEYINWTLAGAMPAMVTDAGMCADHLKRSSHKLGLNILLGDEMMPSQKEWCGYKGTTLMPDEHNELVQQAYYDRIADLFHEWGVSFIELDAAVSGGDSEHSARQPRLHADDG
ncbi:hypothetical protein MBANPS3_004548 [Mucor bainieri]